MLLWQEAPSPDEDINFYAQSLVLIGNLLYEQSQITAAVDQEGWKEMVWLTPPCPALPSHAAVTCQSVHMLGYLAAAVLEFVA